MEHYSAIKRTKNRLIDIENRLVVVKGLGSERGELGVWD